MRYNAMIKNFICAETQAIWNGTVSRRLAVEVQKIVRRKLRFLDAAASPADLRSPPGNWLEALKGDRKGCYSIRVNDQWRICFRFEHGNACDVELVDYH